MKLVPLRQANVKWMNAPRQKNLNSLQLWTYKKDRFVKVERTEQGMVLTESGFVHQELKLDEKDMKKHLKEAFNREFPRSTRVYLQEN